MGISLKSGDGKTGVWIGTAAAELRGAARSLAATPERGE